MAKGQSSEELIIDTAKRIFLKEGRLHATTADIGKAAGLPRTSVHYYFRTRDLLFKHVFTDALQNLTEKLNEVVESNIPFRKKIEKYVEVWLENSLEYPYLDTFVVTEIIAQNYKPVDKLANVRMNAFAAQVKAAMGRGEVKGSDPIQFILNLFSLLRYPSVTAPLYKELLGLDDKRYTDLLKKRQKEIVRLLLS
ncbi:MAG TPA: TetR/AcrR family transcriptional regulator [Cyclobacteriaceae bacterium]|nr:TetR/AcrR family transcriptional regulator [Cyclobacteriaceae bacterium]